MDILKSVWFFIQNQLLGMHWLHSLLGRALEALGLDTASRLGGSIHFFVYDIIKITLSLVNVLYIFGIYLTLC